jgi:hypothetical protein
MACDEKRVSFTPLLRVFATLQFLFGAAVRLAGQDDTKALLLRVSHSVMDTVARLP